MNALMGHLPQQNVKRMHGAWHINLLSNVGTAQRRAKITLIIARDAGQGNVFGFDDVYRVRHGNRVRKECAGILKASAYEGEPQVNNEA